MTDAMTTGGVGECKHCGGVFANVEDHESKRCASKPPVMQEFAEFEPTDRRDGDGNRVTLSALCRLDPAWAASRIRHLEKQLKENAT